MERQGLPLHCKGFFALRIQERTADDIPGRWCPPSRRDLMTIRPMSVMTCRVSEAPLRLIRVHSVRVPDALPAACTLWSLGAVPASLAVGPPRTPSPSAPLSARPWRDHAPSEWAVPHASIPTRYGGQLR